MSRDESAPGVDGTTPFKAFVGGLSYQIGNEELKSAFDRYDSVAAEVMVDKHTNRPRGFGFVYFKDEVGLKDAISQMHEKELEGRRISVVRAVPQDQTKPGTPAAILGAGAGARRDYRREAPRYGGDRYGGDRGYERGAGYGGYERGGGYGGYDPRYAYDSRSGGYERGYSGGYGGYERDPYRDPYGARSYGGYGSGYGGHYDDRSGYAGGSGGYDYSRSGGGSGGYDDRGAGGPDRRGYSAARAAPYERPPERRPADPPARR